MNLSGYIYFISMMAGLVLAGCSVEEPGERVRGQATVTLRGIGASSGDGTGIDEDAIEEIDLLVFHHGMFYQRSPGYGLAAQGDGHVCSFNVDIFDGDVSLFFIANAREDIDNNLPYKNQDIESVRKQLTTPYTRESLGRSTMPMSAFRDYTGIAEDFTLSGIELYRAGAKVEVVLKEEVKDYFELETVQVYRANDLAQLVPDAASITYDSGQGRDIVSSPSVPDGARQRINTYQVECENSVMTEPIYIPESVGPQPAEDATCIVLRGSYNGNPSTYYRLEFLFAPPYDKLGEVLRNARYRITVNDVQGDGTTEPGEIPGLDPLDFTVEVLGWSEDELGAPAEYMAVSSHLINLHFYENSTGIISVKTTLSDYRIRWCDKDGNVQGGDEAGIGGELKNDHFKVAVEDGGKTLRATAMQDNEDGYKYGYILVSSGNIELVVTIRQASRAMRDYIHIFNLTLLYGNIGDEVLQVGMQTDPFAAYGRGLKELLKNQNNYGPYGTIPFEGFYISGLPFQSDLTPYLLEIFDVIYIPSARADVVNTTEAGYLDRWVQQPNKVLVVQSDMGSNLELLDYFGVETEAFSILNRMEYKVSDRAPAIIAGGPFGNITGTIPISQPGGASMIDANTHPWITPILVRSEPGYENYMIIGLDEEKKILYCGDYRLYMKQADYGGVMTGGGVISNVYDVMLANIWAWIAETVLGDYHGSTE